MMIKAMQTEYGMLDNRSANQFIGADGAVSRFQKSSYSLFFIDNSFKG